MRIQQWTACCLLEAATLSSMVGCEATHKWNRWDGPIGGNHANFSVQDPIPNDGNAWVTHDHDLEHSADVAAY